MLSLTSFINKHFQHLVRLCMVLSAMLVITTGCGQSGPKLVPMHGVVTFQGKSIAPGSVFLEPVNTSERGSSLLQLDGSFVMRTYPHGDGVRPGDYCLYLQLGRSDVAELLPFCDVTTSPILLTVPEDGLPAYRLELTEHLPKPAAS